MAAILSQHQCVKNMFEDSLTHSSNPANTHKTVWKCINTAFRKLNEKWCPRSVPKHLHNLVDRHHCWMDHTAQVTSPRPGDAYIYVRELGHHWCSWWLVIWALSQYKDGLSRYGDFHYKDEMVVRLSFIFVMGIPLLVRQYLYGGMHPVHTKPLLRLIIKWAFTNTSLLN